MTSVDVDLRSGRRLETGRRSENIIYIQICIISDKKLFSLVIQEKLFNKNSYDYLEWQLS
jgi:hypothetical protein